MTDVHDGATLRAALAAIAGDFSFSWTPGARALFAELAPARFSELGHNPTALLSELTDDDLGDALTADYALRLGRVQERLAAEAERPTWWQERSGPDGCLVAYFSAEFGLDESLPVYSGGLGILAGDHLKAASELGVPLVGVGLLYRRGYFRQRLDEGDRQVERYPRNDTSRLPLTLVPMAPVVELADDDGRLVPVRLGVWRAQVGRVALYLLDTKVEGNPDWARDVTDTLYGGDRQNRLRQELVLGIGGVRVLRRLGLAPTVFHLNEGHSAFLQLERLREAVVDDGVEPEQALEQIRRSTVFTTHTPVPAGNEVFDAELVRRHVGPLVEACGLQWDAFAALGKVQPDDAVFGLTPFALRTSAYANGVSELHGAVSREMWHALWPEPAGRRGADHVDHERRPPAHLDLRRARGPARLHDAEVRARGRALRRGALDGAPGREAEDARVRRPDARRRRASTRTCSRSASPAASPRTSARACCSASRSGSPGCSADPDRPLQILVAGKAHPADAGGKDVIQHVVDFARDPAAAGRVVFLTDYEMTLARRLVQGVDVWLNTPRRPLEASGTSGMKAALNGVLNCSILDGWWAEGYAPERGFAIGGVEVAPSQEEQDAADAESLYALLEQEVVPAYYERDAAGLPARLDRDDAALDLRARRPVRHDPHGDRVRRPALPAGARREKLRFSRRLKRNCAHGRARSPVALRAVSASMLSTHWLPRRAPTCQGRSSDAGPASRVTRPAACVSVRPSVA